MNQWYQDRCKETRHLIPPRMLKANDEIPRNGELPVCHIFMLADGNAVLPGTLARSVPYVGIPSQNCLRGPPVQTPALRVEEMWQEAYDADGTHVVRFDKLAMVCSRVLASRAPSIRLCCLSR